MKDYVCKGDVLDLVFHALVEQVLWDKKTAREWLWKKLYTMPTVQLDETQSSEPKVEMAVSFYDQSEIHHNCTVEVFTNSVTGDVSIGWWHEEEYEDDERYDE